MCFASKPKMPKAPWVAGKAETPTIKMAGWLRNRLTAGSATDINPSVTIGPPNGGAPTGGGY